LLEIISETLLNLDPEDLLTLTHDTSSQNKDTKNTIKVDMDQKGTLMLPIKIQNTDFEKHFVKFLSTSSNKDVDTEVLKQIYLKLMKLILFVST
jgi:hypothetical protein